MKIMAVEMDRVGERRVAGVGLDHPILPLRTMRHGLRFKILDVKLTELAVPTVITLSVVGYVVFPSITYCSVGFSQSIRMALELMSHCTKLFWDAVMLKPISNSAGVLDGMLFLTHGVTVSS